MNRNRKTTNTARRKTTFKKALFMIRHERPEVSTEALLTRQLKCGPQDSNLQPRDSRALAFPRGLDYLILPPESRTAMPGKESLVIPSVTRSGGRALGAGVIVGAHP